MLLPYCKKQKETLASVILICAVTMSCNSKISHYFHYILYFDGFQFFETKSHFGVLIYTFKNFFYEFCTSKRLEGMGVVCVLCVRRGTCRKLMNQRSSRVSTITFVKGKLK